MQAMKYYHAKALETLTALDLQMDFAAHTSYVAKVKEPIVRSGGGDKPKPSAPASALPTTPYVLGVGQGRGGSLGLGRGGVGVGVGFG